MLDNEIIKLKPVFKDYIWGGNKIRNVLKKHTGLMTTIAESWEFSTHPDGVSYIGSGNFEGKTLKQYFDAVGWEGLGDYAVARKQLPIMIKLIDANENLSIQVHPGDKYALKYENDNGKNEMWYIVDAEPNAFIYLGFIRDISKKEVAERVKNGTLEDILNKVPVKKGQSYYIPAGTVHAIGAGCLICEVQQASNVTYRLYDYGRRDVNGKPRKLHLNSALKVLKTKKTYLFSNKINNLFTASSTRGKLLTRNQSFKVTRYDVKDRFSISSTSFLYSVMVVVDGRGKVSDGVEEKAIKTGDTFLLQDCHALSISGNCVVLMISM